MATLNLAHFSAELDKGASRPNLFKVILSPRFGAGDEGVQRKLSFLCKATQIPASTIGVVNVPFRGRILKLAGDRTFADWTITVINDHDWTIRTSFDKWSNDINRMVDNISLRGSSFGGERYMQDATIHHLGRDGAETATYLIKDCWPSEIAAIDLSYDTTDAVEEFTVTLAYQHFELGPKTGANQGQTITAGL